MSTLQKIHLFTANALNILTTIGLLAVLFFDKENITPDKSIILMAWINIVTHIIIKNK